MDVLGKVGDFIRTHALLSPRQKVIAGVSGGADSLCLLDCLIHLGYPVVMAHLDHQLRPESGDEAARAVQVAEHYGVPCVTGKADVRSFAESGRSTEEAARLLRYRFLVRVAREHKAGVIATGHTADDQVETVLMHFLRGAGPDGLHGMQPSTDLGTWTDLTGASGLTLVRPLLVLSREETTSHCRNVGLEPLQDPSNEDRTIFRNRIRHDLLPELEKYNPGIRSTILRTSDVMTDVSSLLREMVAEAREDVFQASEGGPVAFRIPEFRSKPEALQRLLVRDALLTLVPDLRDIDYHTSQRAADFITSGRTGACQSVAGGLELVHLGREVILRYRGAPIAFPMMPQLLSGKPLRLEVPGEVELGHGWQLEAHMDEGSASKTKDLMPDAPRLGIIFDASRIPGDLLVRPPQEGDRFRPLGMRGSTKVARLLMNEQIPRLARSNWPLVVSGNEVLWVVGLRMNEAARVDEKTSRYVTLRLNGPSEGSW